MKTTADLLDVNVWLALSVTSHPHHPEALKSWNDLHEPSFCRLTQLGLLRLLCNPRVMGDQTCEPLEAWKKYERILDEGSAQFLDEPATLNHHLGAFLKGAKSARDFWSDAYLAAFARSSNLRLVTFDSGFTRFPGLEFRILEAKQR